MIDFKKEGKTKEEIFLAAFGVSLIVFSTLSLNLYEKRHTNNPDIILIVLESTRADHLSCYGYSRNTSPNICSLAKDGVLFENAYSQDTYTSNVLPVLFTSKPPSAVKTRISKSREPRGHVTLSEEHLTIADYLKGRGYTTIQKGIPGWLDQCNLDQGFQSELKPGAWTYRSSSNDFSSIRKGKKILNESLKENKTFFFRFFKGLAHDPYLPSSEYEGIWENISSEKKETLKEDPSPLNESFLQEKELNKDDIIALYNEEILQADDEIGMILSQLKKAGIYKDSLIIVTSDHGELFKKQGINNKTVWGHACLPYENSIHIPLIIKFPDNQWAGKTVKQPLRHIDIVPTIYDILELEDSQTLPFRSVQTYGKSLIPAIKGKNLNLTIFAESFGRWTLKKGNYYYFLLNTKEACEGNIARDVLLKNSSVTENPTLASRFKSEICKIYSEGLKMRIESERVNYTESMKEELRKLGYLG